MNLKELLQLARIDAELSDDIDVTDLCYDSRLAKPGDLFFALKGVHVDAHERLAEVKSKGVAAAIVERKMDVDLPQIVVPSGLAAMSALAHEFFGRPSEKIPVIGITGTNGKTTGTYLIEDIFRTNKKVCGVMGTINYRFGSSIVDAPNTTPMAIDVQRFLRRLVDGHADAAVMEVSSHALELHRVDHVRYAVAAFTNLTQDHLDFHKDMESYFRAKAKLFQRGPNVKAVVNVDDPYGQRLADELKDALTFGQSEQAKLKASGVTTNLDGIHFTLQLPSGKTASISTNLMGRHNVENCLAAAGACLAFGLSEDQVVAGLNQPHAVPGRLERVEAGQDFVVVVDYAHTHDAMAQVLTALKNTGPRRLLCVFGAGGDRDKTKRPKMGRVAVELADHAYVTSDNPRSEDPAMIARDIEAGIKATGKKNYSVYLDREIAIRRALLDAQKGDIVLIAGKGHETYQIVGTTKHHFSDQEVARAFLQE